MKVAIIGAGPAGLFLAERLARREERVTLFDPKAPWEKPCGGGVTPRVFREFPEIRGLTDQWHEVRELRCILSTGGRVQFPVTLPFMTLSRRTLAEALLKRAVDAGAEFIPEKVKDIERTLEGFFIRTDGGVYHCEFLVGADGAGGICRRRLSRRFESRDICTAFSALVPEAPGLPIVVRFYPDMTGYAWIFPRSGATSIGIAAKGGRPPAKEMKSRLTRFAKEEYSKSGFDLPALIDIRPALLPSLSMETLVSDRPAGPRWALIGDASGIVDPITGEGIYYAFKTADILSESLRRDLGRRYLDRLRRLVEESIFRSPVWCETFYRSHNQRIWGFLLYRSPHVQKIIGDLMQNEQDYPTLKRTLIRALPRAVAQAMRHGLMG